MTRQYVPRSNQSGQKDTDSSILQRTAVRELPAKTVTPQVQTESAAYDRSRIKLDLMQIPVSHKDTPEVQPKLMVGSRGRSGDSGKQNLEGLPVQGKGAIGQPEDKSSQEGSRVQMVGKESETDRQMGGLAIQEFRGLSSELISEGVGGLSDRETPVQRQEEEPKAENKTGLPDRLKEGIESMSGYDLSGVRVNYNSPKPAQLNAHAYTQGQAIEVAPGQERHLPHEAWHVVQQMQGRVRPTMEVNGYEVNGDRGLEREADVMGHRAVQMRSNEIVEQQMDKGPQEKIEEKDRTCTMMGSVPQALEGNSKPTEKEIIQGMWLYNHNDMVKFWLEDGSEKNQSDYEDYREDDDGSLYDGNKSEEWTQLNRYDWWLKKKGPEVLATCSKLVAAFDKINEKIKGNIAAIRVPNETDQRKQKLIEKNRKLGPKLHVIKNEIMSKLFKDVSKREDIAALTELYLRGESPGLPYVAGDLSQETDRLLSDLIELNQRGIITYESQPSQETTEREGVKISQQAFISFSLPAQELELLKEQVKDYNEREPRRPRRLVVTEATEPELAPLKVAFSETFVEFNELYKTEKRKEGGYASKLYVQANSPSRYLELVKKVEVKDLAELEKEKTATIYFDSFEAEPTTDLVSALKSLYEQVKKST